MAEQLTPLDWAIIFGYLIGLIVFSWWLSKAQHSREDYYVGGKNVGPWSIAMSILATQCSTNSILGAPAFVAFAAGGGLIWLQYELAVPIAMIAVMLLLLPRFYRLDLISVYAWLEQRFDLKTRLILSGVFQFMRAFAISVTVYSVALVLESITGLSFFWSIMLIGAVTLIYDVLGGVKGVIYSDVLQMLILITVIAGLVCILFSQTPFFDQLADLPPERVQTLNFYGHGLGDSQTFGFWPMLFGGLFLYVSYYGCDQSQVQRQLCAPSLRQAQKSLLLNGLLRYPIVLLYCLLGVGISHYSSVHADFLSQLPLQSDGSPNLNLAVPVLMGNLLGPGLLGIALVALFAAAMSSLDSVINSLSAVTMEDFVFRFRKRSFSARQELWCSRALTLFWGLLTLTMAFFVGDIASTVLEAINIIGSLINGPILGVFAIGILSRRANGHGAVVGLLAGFGVNLLCWWGWKELSWLWWNPLGFSITFMLAWLLSAVFHSTNINQDTSWLPRKLTSQAIPVIWVWSLAVWSILVFISLWALPLLG